MSRIARQINKWFRWAGGWLRQAEGWQIALLMVIVGALALPILPVVLALAVIVALVLFGRAWLKEFTYLMRLRDDVFPGHNDKLIWAILLIVLAPVGIWLFQTYREAHWPEAKPSRGQVDAFDY
jgi:hypothetical protein